MQGRTSLSKKGRGQQSEQKGRLRHYFCLAFFTPNDPKASFGLLRPSRRLQDILKVTGNRQSKADMRYSVFAAKRVWRRLCQDSPVRKNVHCRLMPSAFSRSALAIFEQVASENLNSNTEELWDLLQARLCISSHQCGMIMMFYTMA